MGCRAVLFDMDGTVLDTLGDLHAAVNRALAEFSLPGVSPEAVRAALGNGAAYLIAHCVPAGTDTALTARVLDWYRPWYDAHCRVLTAPYPGILPLMERLRDRGVKLAIISNKRGGEAQAEPRHRARRRRADGSGRGRLRLCGRHGGRP